MKKYYFVLFIAITSGCVPYGNRKDIGTCLFTNGSNEEILNSANKTANKPIKNLSITEARPRTTAEEETECSAIATYADGTSSSGYISTIGRRSGVPTFKFLTEEEKYHQQELIIERKSKEKQERESQYQSELKKYKSVSINEYPFIMETYCYNKKNLEAFPPEECGISAHGPVGLGPNNLYEKNMTSFNVMLGSNFDIKVEMAEPEMTTFNTRFRNNTLEVSKNEPTVTLGINVIVRDRHSNKVVLSERGDYYKSIHITN
jgi:hypothetical protein